MNGIQNQTVRSILAVAVGLGWSVASQATIVVSNGGAQPNGFYAVSATDVGEIPPATITFGGTANYGSSPGKLFDGGVYGAGSPSATADALLPTPGYVITNSFDLTTAPAGYDLTSIVSLTGVGGGGQGTRLSHKYTLEYAKVSAPSTFLSLTTVNVDASPIAFVDNSELQVTVSDSLAAPIASNVAKLRITFNAGVQVDGQMYREFDINGVASAVPAPEPASLGLLVIGGLLCWRRRKA